MTDTVVAAAIAVPLIVGLVQVLKGLGVTDKYAPVAALIFGLLLSVVPAAIGTDGRAIFDAVVQGLILGLTAACLRVGPRGTLEG